MLSWSLWLLCYGPLSTSVRKRLRKEVTFFLFRGPLVLVGVVALKVMKICVKKLCMGSYLGVERPVWADFGGKVQLKYMCFSVLREC